jgi:plasmid stabilization system protein ParE
LEKVKWSKRSVNSLNKIWVFYAEKASIAIADKIIQEIIDKAENIRFSSQYQQEEYLENDHRRAIVRHFKIIYTFQNNQMNIFDVFDSRQHPGKIAR